MKQKEERKNKGFTLIELMISLAMIGIVTAAMLSIVSFSGTRHTLALEMGKVGALVRSAQSYALGVPNEDGSQVCAFGFMVDSASSCRVFYTWNNSNDVSLCASSGLTANPSAPIELVYVDERYELPNGIEFSSGIGAASAAIFRVPYGDVITARSYILRAGDGATRNVEINSAGRIKY